MSYKYRSPAGRRFSQMRKPIGRKRRFIKRPPRQQNKSFRASNQMVTYMGRQMLPFPPRYRTKFECEVKGFIAAAQTNGQYIIPLNGMHLPFSGSTVPNALPAIAGLQPTGYSVLCNADMYKKYRVYSSKIELSFVPQALTDTVLVALTPGDATGIANTPVALTQPFTRQRQFSSNGATGKDVLSNYVTVHKLAGVTHRAIEDDLSGSYAAAYNATPSVPLNWYITWTTTDAVALATNLTYTIKLVYYCELFNNISANITEV